MRKNIFLKTAIVLLTISLLILSGCSNDSSVVKPARKITGNDGLTIDIEGNNKIELFGNYDMEEVYQITIENKGKYSLNNNDFYSEIFLKDGLRSSEEEKSKIFINSLSDFTQSNIEEMEGVSQSRIKGDSFTNFLSVKTNVPSGQGITSGFEVRACYKYQTIFAETVCINTVRNERKQNCEKNKYSFSSGQAAPIKISNVEITDKSSTDNLVAPRLIITIENTKKGFTTLPEEYKSGCTGQGNLNKILLSNAKIGQYVLECNVENNIIDLSNNRQNIICDLDNNMNIESGDSFNTILQLTLDYGYTTTEEFDIDITRE